MRRNGWSSKTFRELSGDLSDLEIRPYLKPNMDPEDLVREVRQAMKRKSEDSSYQARRVVGKMLHCLAIETQTEGKPVQAVHFIPARGERSARIQVEELRRPSIPKERPCLILDATASELIARRLYGEELTFLRIQARRNLILHQVVSSTFSKSYLGIGQQEQDRRGGHFSEGFRGANRAGAESARRGQWPLWRLHRLKPVPGLSYRCGYRTQRTGGGGRRKPGARIEHWPAGAACPARRVFATFPKVRAQTSASAARWRLGELS